MIRKTIAICLCVLGLTAPVALAQNSTQYGYGETQALPQATNSVTPGAAKTDKLPFTGMDVGVITLVALALVGTGVGLRRATASREGR